MPTHNLFLIMLHIVTGRLTHTHIVSGGGGAGSKDGCLENHRDHRNCQIKELWPVLSHSGKSVCEKGSSCLPVSLGRLLELC